GRRPRPQKTTTPPATAPPPRKNPTPPPPPTPHVKPPPPPLQGAQHDASDVVKQPAQIEEVEATERVVKKVGPPGGHLEEVSVVDVYHLEPREDPHEGQYKGEPAHHAPDGTLAARTIPRTSRQRTAPLSRERVIAGHAHFTPFLPSTGRIIGRSSRLPRQDDSRAGAAARGGSSPNSSRPGAEVGPAVPVQHQVVRLP